MIFNTAIEKRIHFEEDELKWIRFCLPDRSYI